MLGLIRLVGLARRKPAESEACEADAAADAKARAGRVMLLLWLAVAAFSGLMVDNVNTNRINIIFYPLCLLAALGIWRVLFVDLKSKIVAVIVAVIYAASFICFTASYFGDYAKTLSVDFCSGLTDAVKYADGLGSDKIYITSYSRDPTAYSCSEIYTLLGADIDALYFQGKAQAVDADGNPLLPYPERYRYVDFSAFDFDKPAGSVYVYNARVSSESSLFDNGDYETRVFDGFGVAVKIAEDTAPADGESQSGDSVQPGDTDQTGDADQTGDSGQAGDGEQQEPPAG